MDQEFFAAELGLAQARRDKLLSLVQLYKGIRRSVAAVIRSIDTRLKLDGRNHNLAEPRAQNVPKTKVEASKLVEITEAPKKVSRAGNLD
jgi:hypothetical protein